jgi:hypothetical protein
VVSALNRRLECGRRKKHIYADVLEQNVLTGRLLAGDKHVPSICAKGLTCIRGEVIICCCDSRSKTTRHCVTGKS